MAELKLYGETTWMSPWVLHVMVALEEKGLSYELEAVPMPMPAAEKSLLIKHTVYGKVPVLLHRRPEGDRWIAESSAISEYLAETFPHPGHPRIFPADLGDRARARAVMMFCRLSMRALREDRPTASVFGRPVTTPLSEKGKADADELVRIASALVKPGQALFGDWCIADLDFTLTLMRLIANRDPVPQPVVDYALAQWDRKSVRRYLSYVPTMT
jgi:glutathione S-transferase